MSITIPTELLIDFDHHALETSHHREQVLDRVREHPLFYTEANGGYWVATSHALVKQVLRNPDTYSSEKHADGSGGVTIPTVVGPRLIPAEADGLYHRELRRLLTPKFNKATVDAMTPTVDAFIVSTIDRVIELGDFDVVHDIADVIPAGVMVRYLGFPDETRKPFIASIQAALSVIPKASSGQMTPELEAGMAAFGSAVQTIQELVAERRANPTDDVVSYLCGQRLSDDELLWLVFTLMVGGFENPAALISNMLLRLAEAPALRAKLAANPELIPAAVDEFLRMISAGVSLARNVRVDTELGGQQLRAGERILLWLPAANHDRAVFEDADTFKLDRGRCPHVAFGDGPHICIGDKLARLQFHVLLREVLSRMPEYTIDLSRAERFDDAATMYGWRTMPARTNA
ncbi:cytochrome P450 [Mycolicibacterium rhodesiae JS60]|nr:cytochrome P450 [Mycolicibacterium rhodesiae JS60]